MSLHDEMATPMDTIFALGGQPAAYNSTACTVVVVNYGVATEQSPALVLADAIILVRRSEIPQVKHKDTVIFGGISYLVTSVLKGDALALIWKLAVNKNIVQSHG